MGPGAGLRYHALIALGEWQSAAIPEYIRDIVEVLADDSMPAVQNQALELQRAFT